MLIEKINILDILVFLKYFIIYKVVLVASILKMTIQFILLYKGFMIRYIFEINNKSFTTFILGQLHKKYHIILFVLVLLFSLKTILL